MSYPRKFTARGKTQTVTEWSREVGIPANVLFYRLNQGWDGDRVVSQPNRSIGKLSVLRAEEYSIWKGMSRRCRDPKLKCADRYLGRGIRVCDRWKKSFKDFIDDMGPRPSPEHSVERRDNDGGYCPDNCYWATPTEQQRNKRNSALLTHGGETMCIAAWADKTGIPAGTISTRIATLGWTVEKALTTPNGAPVGMKPRLFLTHQGRTMSVSEWSKETGIPPSVIAHRVKKHGWSHEKALTTFGDGRKNPDRAKVGSAGSRRRVAESGQGESSQVASTTTEV
jgi:hypothetical protein